ncbi:MAG: hypothetical protein P1P86_08135 [Bacteroidales bacterium]|nr:hypothetical protein [Bacteroidales bacterium]
MKKLSFYSFAVLLAGALFITACENTFNGPGTEDENSILPGQLTVEIPDALLEDLSALKGAPVVDTLKGREIYGHLRFFIHTGDHAARMVRHMIYGIRRYNIDQVKTVTYESEDDGRIKNLVVVEGPEFDGRTWEYGLTISDAESEGEADGGKGMQIFWNKNPKEGISIIKPYNLDRTLEREMARTMFRIDYSGAGELGYEHHMIVSIAGMPSIDPLLAPFAMDGMKMFVGQNGDFVDVYGNSSHPNAKFLTEKVGYNWAFAASGSKVDDAAVAELGLPLSSLDAEGRDILLEEFSIYNVLYNEVKNIWPHASEEILNAWLTNTEAPGFFNSHGFIQGGEAPGEQFLPLMERIVDLSPYNPKTIANLEINFN